MSDVLPYGLAYVAGTRAPGVEQANYRAVASTDENLNYERLTGPTAARPPHRAGRMFYDEDETAWFLSNGSAWSEV